MKLNLDQLPANARSMAATGFPFGESPRMPDVQAIADAMQGPTQLARAQMAWQNSMAKTFNEGTQVGGARIVTELGFPVGQQLDSVLDLVALPPEAIEVGHSFFALLEATGLTDSAPVEDLMATLETAMTDVMGALADVTSGIPVYGWAAKMIWNVISGVRKLAELIRGQKSQEPEAQRVQFVPGGDLNAGNDTMVLLGTLDWTPVFLPYGGTTKGGYGSEYFASVTIEGGGQRIYPTSEQLAGFGMIPGTTSMHQYIEVEPGAGVGRVRDSGRFYPTARNVGIYGWGQSNLENNPSLYSINARAVREAWAAYLFNLRLWIRETKSLKESTKRKLVNNEVLVRQFGWGPYDMPFKPELGYENFGIDDPDGAIPWKRVNEQRAEGGPPAQTGVAHPIYFARDQERRQWDALDTLMCAYASENQGAFQGFKGEDMAARLEVRRKQLKQHPAVCNVELKDVVDVVYKAAVEFAVEQTDCEAPSGAHMLRLPGDLFRKPPRKGANPVPADFPEYVDSLMITGAAADANARRRAGRPTFIQEYGPAAAAVVAIAAAGGLAYRSRKTRNTP